MNISDLVPWRDRHSLQRRRRSNAISPLRQEMDRLFDDFFRNWESPFMQGEEGGMFNPALNVAETDEAIEATMELPGLSQDDIEITLTREGLTIKGEKKDEEEEQGKNYFRRERSYGYFQRTIPVPSKSVNADKVEASFDNGVLKITLPKSETTKRESRRIPVKTG